MHSELRTLLYDAEYKYLQNSEIEVFKTHIASLAKRLKTYESLRDQEISIFQPIADQLLETFPQENPKVIEQALKHWLSVLRYSGMAMLLNSPEFLERRLLEWLAPRIQAHEMVSIENNLYQLLQSRLKQLLSSEELDLINPFLEQSKTSLLQTKVVI